MYFYKNEISAVDYNLLRQAVAWTPLSVEQAQAGLDHSFLLINCYDENGIVGSARLLWDRGYIAYLADVMVRPQHQGRGLGRHMVDYLLREFKARIPRGWRVKVVLVATKDREAFYERWGFVSRPNAKEGAGMNLWVEADQGQA